MHMNKRIGALAVAAALLLGAAGCGGSGDAKESGGSTPEASSAKPTGKTGHEDKANKGDEVTEQKAALAYPEPTVSPDARTKYGTVEVNTATDLVVSVINNYGYNNAFVLAEEGQDVEAVLAATQDMTPKAAQKWEQAISDFTSGNSRTSGDAATTVYSYALYAPNDGSMGVYPPKTGPGVVNQQVHAVQISLSADERLAVHAKTSADLRIIRKANPSAPGKNQLLRFNRDTTYWLKQTKDGWRIDDWNSDMTTGGYRPDN